MKNKWEQISSKWKLFSPEAKKHWVELSEEEVMKVGGNRSILSSYIQKKYRVPKKEADKQIEAWANTLKV